jgi:DNA-damage-inducible protein J
MLNVRMDDELKQEATAVLDSLGLSASDAVRILFTRIVRQRAFPMELQAPAACEA